MAEFIVVTKRDYERFGERDFAGHLPEERAVARDLYEQRTFRQIWGRADGAGVVVLMEAKDLADVERLWAKLPLVQNNMIGIEVIPVAAYRGFCNPGDEESAGDEATAC